jgi:tetratricopeptide (TPR) repeat protein
LGRSALLAGVISICLILFAGCAATLRSAVAGSLVEDVAKASARQGDIILVADAVPPFILLLEGLLESDPNNSDLLTSASQIYLLYGSLVEINEPARARDLYAKAKSYGQRALAQEKGVGALIQRPYVEFVELLDHLDGDNVSVVFWAASSWGAWIGASLDSMAALAEMPKVIALMEWVLETDETFEFGGPHIFLGVYHAALPPSLGGKPEKARRHFERAMEISRNRALMVHVLMAKYYARQIFDREMYVSLLNDALELPVDGEDRLVLQNTAAKAHARRLLEETDEFF